MLTHFQVRAVLDGLFQLARAIGPDNLAAYKDVTLTPEQVQLVVQFITRPYLHIAPLTLREKWERSQLERSWRSPEASRKSVAILEQTAMRYIKSR